MRFRDWWNNTNYDRGTMQRFYIERPEWSDLPPEVVATLMSFQFFAVGEAGREVWKNLRLWSWSAPDPERNEREPLDVVRVFDLTEQRRDVMGQDEDGTPNGEDYIEARWVSQWERIKEDPEPLTGVAL